MLTPLSFVRLVQQEFDRLVRDVQTVTEQRVVEPSGRLGRRILRPNRLLVGDILRHRIQEVGPRLALGGDAVLEQIDHLVLNLVRFLLAREERLRDIPSAVEAQLLARQLRVELQIRLSVLVGETDDAMHLFEFVGVVGRVPQCDQRLSFADGAGQGVHADDARADEPNRDRLGTVVREIDEEVLLHLLALVAVDEVLFREAREEPNDPAVAERTSRLVDSVLTDDRIEDVETLGVLDGGVDLADDAERLARVFANDGEFVLEGFATGDLQGFLENLPRELALFEDLLGCHETGDHSAQRMPRDDTVPGDHVVIDFDFVCHMNLSLLRIG
jgi:hypothetical protein